MLGGVRRVAKLADVGTGDEAAGLGGADHQAFWGLALDRGEHVVELDEHVLRQRIGAGALLVDDEPGDAVRRRA